MCLLHSRCIETSCHAAIDLNMKVLLKIICEVVARKMSHRSLPPIRKEWKENHSIFLASLGGGVVGEEIKLMINLWYLILFSLANAYIILGSTIRLGIAINNEYIVLLNLKYLFYTMFWRKLPFLYAPIEVLVGYLSFYKGK